MSLALTTRELDMMRCSNPDCTEDHGPLYIHANCHPAAPPAAYYDSETGCVTFKCSKCDLFVVSMRVADPEP